MNSNNENQKKEALLDELLQGGFGSEVNFDEEIVDEKFDDETVAEAVRNYTENFGSHKQSDYFALVPSSILDSSDYDGYLYGISRPETERFYVVESKHNKYPIIGYIADNPSKIPDNNSIEFTIIRRGSRLEGKTKCSNAVRIERYDEQVKLFSRNSGLLESSSMLDKCAVIIGCGSVGSFIALQLARSGVGKFVLCDTDILEIHNICRHQCGFDDLGRYKVDAVRDKILNINPKADVDVLYNVIQRIQMDELLPFLGENSVVIGTGDNRESSRYACNTLAIPTGSSFVSTCCWKRAFAGEVIYWTPGRNLPCYQCALGELVDSKSDSDEQEMDINYWGSGGTDKIGKPFSLVTSKEANVSAATADFISFVLSENGRDIISYEHFPVNANPSVYTSTMPNGVVRLNGCADVSAVIQKLTEEYRNLNPSVSFEIKLSDSTEGARSVIDGNSDMGMLSRKLDDIENESLNCAEFAIDLAFEPGISADIDFVSIIAVKVILDLLNKNNHRYTPRVINYLTEYTWICNTNEPRIGGEKAEIFSRPLQITNTLHFVKKEGCSICGDK